MFARWSAASGYSSKSRFTVHHTGGTTTLTMDQRVNGGRWNLLGDFDMAAASGHKVVVDDTGADNTVSADAVRFVRIGDARRVVADAVKIVPNTAEDALYVHADHLGAPQKMTDDTAAVAWNAALTPFGLVDSITGTATNHQRFPGQYADAASDLHYNYFRHYDPSTGRYVTSDPIGFEGGLNTYAYVDGNPVGIIDPSGLFFTPDTLADLGFIAFDAFRLISDNLLGTCDNLNENLATLGADVIGLFAPGVTGLGAGVRAGRKIENSLSGARGTSRAPDRDALPGQPPPGPDFVVSKAGTTIPVPQGASGPRPTRAPGVQFTKGSGGGHGFDSRVTGVRIMDQTSRHPKRVIYMNKRGQTVDPYTGNTVRRSDPSAHIPWK